MIRPILKYLLMLFLLFLITASAGIIVDEPLKINAGSTAIALLSLSFTVTSAVSLIIFFRGTRKEAREQVIHSFISISSKFVLELFIALVWFLVAKKTTTECILLFFVLYLSFSAYSIGTILNKLKKKPL